MPTAGTYKPVKLNPLVDPPGRFVGRISGLRMAPARKEEAIQQALADMAVSKVAAAIRRYALAEDAPEISMDLRERLAHLILTGKVR